MYTTNEGKRVKEYLGDGVYAQTDSRMGIVLTTEDGISVINTIYLEPAVFQALLRFAAKAAIPDSSEPK